MAGKIPKSFIDDLIAKTDIVETINQRLELKRKGREYMACCPFHGEKTPSFSVSPDKQFYHCFGCGAHGNVIGFLMEYDRLHYVEAIEALAESQGVEVPREDEPSQERIDYTPLYELMEKTNRYFQQQLKATATAVSYLKSRGLSGSSAKTFGLGYAPAGWQTLQDHFGQHFNPEKCLEAGLLSRNDKGKIYDKFRERIMFPIRDTRGRVIAFGGRVIDQGEPKYLNSPETPIFHKSQVLYGLYEARQHHRQLDSIIVTEGYMDVVALAEHDIRNAVATLGTAVTAEHVKQLLRFTSKITFCFDGDRAGRDAAWKALKQCLPVIRDNQEIRFLLLADGEDPDSLVKTIGNEGFQTQINEAATLSEYFLTQLQNTADTSTMEGRAHFAQESTSLLNTMQSGYLREQLIQSSEKIASTRLKATAPEDNTPPPISRPKRPRHQLSMTAMRQLIITLLNQPNLYQDHANAIAQLDATINGYQLLNEICAFIGQKEHCNAAQISEHFRDSEHTSSISKLMLWQPPNAESWNWKHQLNDAIQQLNKQQRGAVLDQLIKISRERELSMDESEKLKQLLDQS